MAAVTSAVAAVGGLAVSAYGSKQSAKAANRSANAQEAAAAAQADLIDSQRKMGQEKWELYKQNFLPIEQQLAARAKEGLDDSYQVDTEQSAQKAAAGVAANFQQARQQLQSTPGLDPSSQQYLKEANKLNMQEAASTASAENTARDTALQSNFTQKQQAQAKKDALTLDAINAGNGIASSATSSLNSALSAQGGVVNATTNQANTAQSNFNSSLNGFGTALGVTAGTVGNLFGGSSNTTTTTGGSYGVNANYTLGNATNYNAGGLGLKL